MTAWRPMATAPKDTTPILLLFKKPIPMANRDCWAGLMIVGNHSVLPADGFDIGWQFAAPVGHGGFPDDWFEGWLPLPAAVPVVGVAEAGVWRETSEVNQGRSGPLGATSEPISD